MRKPEDLVPMQVLEGLGIKWENLAEYYAISGFLCAKRAEKLYGRLQDLLDTSRVRYEIVPDNVTEAIKYNSYKNEFEKALFSNPKQDKIDELKNSIKEIEQQVKDLENL